MLENRPFVSIFIFERNYGAITKACNGRSVYSGNRLRVTAQNEYKI
jgi:hypothetical protein